MTPPKACVRPVSHETDPSTGYMYMCGKPASLVLLAFGGKASGTVWCADCVAARGEFDSLRFVPIDSVAPMVEVPPAVVPTLSPAMAALVEGVKAYAEEHYADGGWDVIAECWEDADIADQVKGARTVSGAIRRMEPIVDVFADRQADARNSAF